MLGSLIVSLDGCLTRLRGEFSPSSTTQSVRRVGTRRRYTVVRLSSQGFPAVGRDLDYHDDDVSQVPLYSLRSVKYVGFLFR